MKKRTTIAFTSLILALTTGLFAVEKGRIADDLNSYQDMLFFKENDSIFIYEHDGKKIKYGNFEEDQPQSYRNINIFDILYEDVPTIYESALSSLAKKDYAKAIELFEASKSQKTNVTKTVFSNSKNYKNFIHHKLFLAHMGLGDVPKALDAFKEAYRNRDSHSRYRLMVDAMPLLVETGETKLAIDVAKELGEIRLSRRETVDLALQKCLALSLSGKYRDARDGLSELLTEYGADYDDLERRVKDAETTIMVYHEKNYRDAIKHYEKILEEDRTGMSADDYLKLADAYVGRSKWEEARWNILQAYLIDSTGKRGFSKVYDRLKKVHENLPSPEGKAALEDFMEKVKATP